MPKRRDESAPLWRALREAEGRLFRAALDREGTIRGAAEYLGVSAGFFSERSRQLGIRSGSKRKKKETMSKNTFMLSEMAREQRDASDGMLVETLMELLLLLIQKRTSPLVADCTSIFDLLARGLCTPHEAAQMIHRARDAQRAEAPPTVRGDGKRVGTGTAAQWLNVSRVTIQRAIEKKHLRGGKDGRRFWTTEAALREFAAATNRTFKKGRK